MVYEAVATLKDARRPVTPAEIAAITGLDDQVLDTALSRPTKRQALVRTGSPVELGRSRQAGAPLPTSHNQAARASRCGVRRASRDKAEVKESIQMHESREQDEYQEPGREHRAGIEHEAGANQRRHEPIPASSSSDKDQAAAGGNQGQAVRGPERSPAPGQRDAVRDMIGEPQPQGDVPDAPAAQITTADHE